MTRWLTADEQRAWRAYLQATRAVQDAVASQLHREARMPHAYYEVLVRLSEAPGRELRMSELARLSFSSPSRLSHAVARLEEKGWVRRARCPSDQRGQLAVLTDEGFAALAAAAPGHVERVRTALFDPLTAEQVEQLRAISAAVVAHLSAEATAADPAGGGRTSASRFRRHG